MVHLLRLTSLFLFFVVLPIVTQAQNLHTYIDQDSVHVGERLTYSIVLEKDQPYSSVTFPGEDAFNSDELSFLSREHHRVTDNRDSLVYHLQFFGVDDYEIPRFDVLLSNQTPDTTILTTTPVPLFFSTVLSEEDTAFRPFKPIFDFAAALWPYILALLLMGLLIWFLYRKYRYREHQPEPQFKPEPRPFINPIEVLQKSLRELSDRGSPLDDGNFKEFYVRLGDAIRQYFEDVYQIDALEMTSREILQSLIAWPADKQVIQITRNVLNEADMVKFAKFEPTNEQARRSLLIANEFLQTVKELDRPHISRLKDLHEQKDMKPSTHSKSLENANV